MPTIRNKRSSNFTVVGNNIVRDTNLSAKAKGILMVMLSMPEDWAFSMTWLVKQFTDQTCSISSGVNELMEAGYLSRTRLRDAHGRVYDVEYCAYDEPQPQLIAEQAEKKAKKKKKSPKRENRIQVKNDADDDSENAEKSPKRENPILENPILENPIQENPILENRALLNTNIVLKTNSTKQSINHSLDTAIDRMIEDVRNRIGYNELVLDCDYEVELIDTIVELIVEAESSRSIYIRIGTRDVSTSMVKRKLRDLTPDIVRDGAIEPYYKYAMDNTISNPRALMLSFLYNATATYGLGNLASEAQAAAVSVRTHIPDSAR